MSDREHQRAQREAASDAFAQASGLASRRLAEYVELWESAMSRMADADYHSEDLVDDWFTWWGKCVRDSTAVAALSWQAYTDATTRRDESGAADDR